MRFFNKTVFSKKEPTENDIWFNGKVWKIYLEGEWKDISLDINNLNPDTDKDVEEVWENVIKNKN